MKEYKYIIIIVPRELGESYVGFLKKHRINTIYSTLCSGTASESILDYLGIEKTDKTMLRALVPANECRKLIRGFIRELGIDIPGNGIALTVPIDCIGGISAFRYLTGKNEVEISEVKEMEEFKYSVILSIVEKGCSSLVMDAARSVGANGGTVIRAKGTAPADTTKFFGMSIAKEKDMLLIVARREDHDAIMTAIMAKAGLNTPAKGIVFSLPVESVAGLRSITDEITDSDEK